MHPLNRRNFLRQMSVAVTAGTLHRYSTLSAEGSPRLSFTTLGCPDWTLRKSIQYAATHGFQEIEVRGIRRELDLTRCPDFSTSQIGATRRMAQDRGIPDEGQERTKEAIRILVEDTLMEL